MNTFRLSAALLIAWLVSLCGGQLLAQPKNSSNPKPNERREVSVQDKFEPAFNIEPLFHKLRGRGGDAISFKFQILARDASSEVEISPVGLKQDITGQITYDPTGEVVELITMVTPKKITLEPDKPFDIEGIVQIPRSNSKHHSLGILVRDLGRKSNAQSKTNPDGTKTTNAGISFVTQYVLRLDLDVEGARGENGSLIRIEDIRIVSQDGRPKLQAVLFNNSDSTFEYEARARVRFEESDRNKPIRLVLPARSNVEDDARFTSRVLPRAKIRMEELLPEAIASGKYDVDMEILVNDRIVGKSTHPVFVNAKDFPAQEILIAQIGEDLQVSPAQIELSQLRSGTRRLSLQLKNVGSESKAISLKMLTLDSLESQSLSIQPAEFTLAPKSVRRIAITLKGQPNPTETTQYGRLLVQSKTDKRDFEEKRELPVALLLKKQPPVQLEVAPLVWDNRGDYPTFRTTVKNLGDGHVALDARLSIFSRSGGRISSYAGFGKWLMPASSQSLEFRLEQALQPGEYLLRYEIQNGTDKPITKDQTITVTDLEIASR
jgi:hypothetical protein